MPANERHIALFDLDAFFVSVERLENNHLIGKPVIIGGLSGRGVVASCSYEARQYGVHSAMPMRMARMLCKDAHVIRGDMEKYSRYSKTVTQVIAEKAPVYEKASVDEHYIDLTGMDRFFGSLQWTKELRKDIIRHTGLPISFGLSVNKTVSKIAAGEAKPNGEIFIPCKQVRPFINPLSISKIPMIGQKTFQLLRSMGISKVATLSAMPPELIKNALGKNGIVIWKKANGIDTSPVEAYSEKKSISTEHTFQQDTADIALMNELVIKMAEKLAFQLRKQQKLTSCITVKIRYANFDTHTLQKKIAYTAFDHMIINTAKELFKKIYQRRMMIRLIGIRLSALAGGTQQLSLFEDTSEMANLYYTMDKIRKRFGNNAVGRAVGEKRQ
jgi:DNA polymerase IV